MTMFYESENLVFYYQEFLTDEYMEKENVSRPLDVMGSYAVYHESKKNNEYKTGKAFHLYRPLFIDAKGDTAYGNMSIANGIFTIYFPSGWVKTAILPITIDPTFGYTSIGGTTQGLGVDVGRFGNFTLSGDNVNVYETSVYFEYLYGGVIPSIMGIYDNNPANDRPLDLVWGDSNVLNIPNSGSAWYNYTSSSNATLSSGSYHIGILVDIACSNFKYDSTTYINQKQNDDDYTDGLSDPWGTYKNQQTRFFSVYASYELAGGTAFTSYLTDTWAITDAFAKGVMKAFGNIFGFGDALARGIMKSFTDIAGFQDGLDALIGYLASLVDTLAFSLDNFEKIGTYVRALPEGLSILDSVYASIVEGFLIALTDLMTIIDSSFTRDAALTVMIPLGFYFLILMSAIGIILLIFSKVIGRMIGGFVFMICMVLVNSPLQYVFPSHTVTIALDVTLQSLLTTLYVVLIVANFGLAIYSYMKNSEYGRYP